MLKDLLLIGGGGHCKSCIEVIEKGQEYKIVGILDTADKIGLDILGYPVIGTDEDIYRYKNTELFFLITVGHIKSNKVRKNIYSKLVKENLKIGTVISPFAIKSKYSSVSIGTILMHNTILNSDSYIGENCIINSKALIEHDCKIGNHTHISTGAIINGGCTVGDNVFIGSRTVIAQGITIGDNITIGAGSLVLKSIYAEGVYVGSPVRKIA